MTLIIGLLLCLGVLVALLAIPVEVTFDLRRRETFDGVVTIGWLFGLVHIPIPIDRTKQSEKGTEKTVAKEKKKGEKKREKGVHRAKKVLFNRAFRRRLTRFAEDLFRTITFSGFLFHARIGVGDPADTGMLWGIIGPVSGVLRSVPGADIQIEPEFMQEVFEMQSAGEVLVIPLSLLSVILLLVLSPVTLRLLWAIR
jgi:hypothetical protein